MSSGDFQEKILGSIDSDRNTAWMLAVILRVGVLALLAACPWYYGMVLWQSQLLCAGIVLGLFIATYVLSLVKGMPLGNALTWSLAGLLLLALLQTLPLTEGIWQGVSVGAKFERKVEAFASEFLDEIPVSVQEDHPIAAVEAPRTLSIHPLQTRASAVTLATAIAMLAICGLLFRDRGWAIALLLTISIVAMLHALVGLAQSVSWSDWTLLQMDTVNFFGTFISRNSAPQFYALGIGCTLGILVWWRSRNKTDREKTIKSDTPQ